jgi:pseudaminic acid cytidylyltransferase
MRSIAIIPARGGSKRLQRKNVIDFFDAPIIAYTIKAALESCFFDRVITSTDDSEIANVAAQYGSEVFIRSDHLASDEAQVKDVCISILSAESIEGRDYDVFSCLYPTAPLRNKSDILLTMELLNEVECNFSMGVTEYPYPPHQALKLQKGFLKPMWPELIEMRSQDVGKLYVDNGSTYCAKVEKFLLHKTFYGPGLRGHVMPFERSIDIDIEADLLLARNFYSFSKK